MENTIDLINYLKNYGTFEAKVKSFNDEMEYTPSDDVITYVTFSGAKIELVNESNLKIIRNIKGITNFELIIDGVVKDTFIYDETEKWILDLSAYSIDVGTNTVSIRAIGDEVNENISNDITYTVEQTI